MEKPLITVIIVNYNSSEFVGLNLHALRKLTLNSYKVIIRDNNSRSDDYKNLQNIIKEGKFDNTTLYRTETNLLGSMAHGEALNELVSKIDTTYGVILDADAVFLQKEWDKILIEKLTDKLPIFGTQADESGNKPMDFPLMFAMIFKTEILKNLNIDFRPKDVKSYLDTGWELREKYLGGGYNGGLLYDFNTRNFKKGPFKDIISSEYYLSNIGEGKIFAAHFGRGSSPKAKNLLKIRGSSSLFVRAVNWVLSYVNIIKWQKDKKIWIDICLRIINEQ